MPTAETLVLFTAAAVLMNLSPGPSNLYVMARGLAQGARGGYVAALGLALGGLVHVAATAGGLSAVFALSPLAYATLKLAGAAYLVYLGVRYLLERDRGPGAAVPPPATHAAILRQSVLVEVTNPKTALFFLAFLPQFVDVSRGPPAPQLLVLGAIVTASAIPCDLLVARFAGSVGRRLRESPRARRLQSRLSGSVLVGLGAYVALDAREAG